MSEDNPESKDPQEQQAEQHGQEMKNRWSETPAGSSSSEQTGASPRQEIANQAPQENRDYIQSIQNQSYDNPTPSGSDALKVPSETEGPQEKQNEQRGEQHAKE